MTRRARGLFVAERSALQEAIEKNRYGKVSVPPAPPAGCTYPMNADESEVLALGLDGRLTLIDAQTFEYTVDGGGTSTLGALPPGGSTQSATPIDLSTGKKAFEFQILQLDAVNSTLADENIRTVLGYAAQDFSKLYTVLIEAMGDETYRIRATDNFGNFTIASGLVAPPDAVGIVVDADAGNVYVRYNGTNHVVTADTMPANSMLLCSGGETNTLSAPNVGKVARWRNEMAAANFIETYPAGVTDICGNAV